MCCVRWLDACICMLCGIKKAVKNERILNLLYERLNLNHIYFDSFITEKSIIIVIIISFLFPSFLLTSAISRIIRIIQQHHIQHNNHNYKHKNEK